MRIAVFTFEPYESQDSVHPLCAQPVGSGCGPNPDRAGGRGTERLENRRLEVSQHAPTPANPVPDISETVQLPTPSSTGGQPAIHREDLEAIDYGERPR